MHSIAISWLHPCFPTAFCYLIDIVVMAVVRETFSLALRPPLAFEWLSRSERASERMIGVGPIHPR